MPAIKVSLEVEPIHGDGVQPDISITAPALFYLPPSMVVACRSFNRLAPSARKIPVSSFFSLFTVAPNGQLLADKFHLNSG